MAASVERSACGERTEGFSGLADAFQNLPGHERQYVAKSEYLFKRLQPPMDDLFYLGSDYQQAFERFEVIYALQHVSISDSGWGPIGRFGYRRKVYSDFLAEADREGQQWPLLKAGLFGGPRSALKRPAHGFKTLCLTSTTGCKLWAQRTSVAYL